MKRRIFIEWIHCYTILSNDISWRLQDILHLNLIKKLVNKSNFKLLFILFSIFLYKTCETVLRMFSKDNFSRQNNKKLSDIFLESVFEKSEWNLDALLLKWKHTEYFFFFFPYFLSTCYTTWISVNYCLMSAAILHFLSCYVLNIGSKRLLRGSVFKNVLCI